MSKDHDTLLNNFVTVTKRLPLKARFLVGVCMVVVVFELISGVVELNGDDYSSDHHLRNNRRPSEVGKVRERKEINLEAIGVHDHDPHLVEGLRQRSFRNAGRRNRDKENNIEVNNQLDNLIGVSNDNPEKKSSLDKNNLVEIKDNVRLKYKKVEKSSGSENDVSRNSTQQHHKMNNSTQFKQHSTI